MAEETELMKKIIATLPLPSSSSLLPPSNSSLVGTAAAVEEEGVEVLLLFLFLLLLCICSFPIFLHLAIRHYYYSITHLSVK